MTLTRDSFFHRRERQSYLYTNRDAPAKDRGSLKTRGGRGPERAQQRPREGERGARRQRKHCDAGGVRSENKLVPLYPTEEMREWPTAKQNLWMRRRASF